MNDDDGPDFWQCQQAEEYEAWLADEAGRIEYQSWLKRIEANIEERELEYAAHE